MTNKKLPENATKTEGAELARRGRGEISAATAVPHVSYDDLRHADRITIDGKPRTRDKAHWCAPAAPAMMQSYRAAINRRAAS